MKYRKITEQDRKDYAEYIRLKEKFDTKYDGVYTQIEYPKHRDNFFYNITLENLVYKDINGYVENIKIEEEADV